MAHKLCVCCGDVFVPRPQAPHQAYCSSTACQRARKRQWQREKLRTDSDYRDNQRDAQRAWLSQNPDYWRQYRRDHLEHAHRLRARYDWGQGVFVVLPLFIFCLTVWGGAPKIIWNNG
ncbi:hypothetical protein [Burkholderia cepacia]|uniref:hypothetical protein n=1 Tax=Burkholderia cepacia TaxID=292 RepID=UPI00299D5639|nr:hypothetical protein [Burkholderia cepacia]